MKNIFYFIFFILVLALGLIFTIYNSVDVPFNYVINSISLPLSLIIILAIVAGAVLGLLASSIIILRLRNEIAHFKKNQKKSDNE
ncbi:MAG: lipopolysaccharide assembly LapA domain-containing protein [Gammaproteobacteria bacterium]